MSLHSGGAHSFLLMAETPKVAASLHPRLSPYEFYRSIGSPKCIAAPMVMMGDLSACIVASLIIFSC